MDTSPIRTSEKVDRLLPALAAVRRDLKPIVKDTPNPAFRGVMYAPLPKVLEAVEPLLAQHGLLLLQWMADGGPERAALAARIYHVESGQWMECVAATDLGKNDPQGVGGAYTYLRRYSLGFLGVVTEKDDDANDASNVGRTYGARSEGASYDRDPRPQAPRPAKSNGRAPAAAGGDDIPF